MKVANLFRLVGGVAVVGLILLGLGMLGGLWEDGALTGIGDLLGLLLPVVVVLGVVLSLSRVVRAKGPGSVLLLLLLVVVGWLIAVNWQAIFN